MADLAEILSTIQSGEVDDHLETIKQACRNRRELKAESIMAGARVQIVRTIRPKYLAHLTGEVTGRNMKAKGLTLTVTLDEKFRNDPQYRRYVNPLDGTIRLPADLVEVIG